MTKAVLDKQHLCVTPLTYVLTLLLKPTKSSHMAFPSPSSEENDESGTCLSSLLCPPSGERHIYGSAVNKYSSEGFQQVWPGLTHVGESRGPIWHISRLNNQRAQQLEFGFEFKVEQNLTHFLRYLTQKGKLVFKLFSLGEKNQVRFLSLSYAVCRNSEDLK